MKKRNRKLKTSSRSCRHKRQELRRYGMTQQCGSIYCRDCGQLIREWNAY